MPRFRCPLTTAPVRTEGLFWRPHGCNIAPGTDPATRPVTEDFQNFWQQFFVVAFSHRQMGASCTFVRQRCSLCEAGRSPESNAFLTDTMDNNRELTDKTEKKPRTPSYKYSFRLNEEQNIRFNELLCKAGLEHNRSRFIVKRIFAEEFVVVRRDPSKVQFVARLNDFYFQFQKLRNNYNQIVKVINAHFSNVAIPHQIAALEQRTRELKALSMEILNLAKQAKEWLRI